MSKTKTKKQAGGRVFRLRGVSLSVGSCPTGSRVREKKGYRLDGDGNLVYTSVSTIEN